MLPEGPHRVHGVPQNSSMPTGYSSKVSLTSNLGRINSLKHFQKNKVNSGSTDRLGINPQYLSISNLKDNPKGSTHQGFKKKKLGGHLPHSRSKEELNFYSNVVSPLPDGREKAHIYDYEQRGFYTERMEKDFKKHQKSASLAESNLHNLYSLSGQSSSNNLRNLLTKEKEKKRNYKKSFVLNKEEIKNSSKSPRMGINKR